MTSLTLPSFVSLYAPHSEIEQDLPVPITGVMRLIWLLRTDIHKRCSLKQRKGRLAFVVWCLLHGLREYKALRESLPSDYLEKLKIPARDKEIAGAGISELMLGFWHLRDDLQKSFPLDTKTSCEKFLYWFLNHIESENPEIFDLAPWQIEYLEQDDPILSLKLGRPISKLIALAQEGENAVPSVLHIEQDIPLKITGVMALVWLQRTDIQTVCNLENRHGRLAFAVWSLLFGQQDSKLLRLTLSTNALEKLKAPMPDSAFQDTPISVLMMGLWYLRPDVQHAFPLDTKKSRRSFLYWFLTGNEYQIPGFYALASWQVTQLQALPPAPSNALPNALSSLAQLVYENRQDVSDTFDITDQRQRNAYLAWFCKEWLSQPKMQYLASPVERAILTPLLPNGPTSANTYPAPAGPPSPHLPSNPEIETSRPFGVNLIGFAYGELGIGEDVRMAALACEAAGIPFAVYNFPPGDNVSQLDQRVSQHVQDNLPYQTNIFCITGFDTVRLFLERGSETFAGHYNIGYWPWELPRWSDEWKDAYLLVNEVWASTRYTKASFDSNATVPVALMPMAVSLGNIGEYSRKDFGLPEDKLLFVFSFDFNSYLARKNPLAPVKAFKTAFPLGSESVGLVIKVMHVNPRSRKWQEFKKLIASDARIHLIDESMRRDKVNALYQVCDCFVSLHRAEGFGRGIAEAMLLGKPAIVTDFSGNQDFTTNDNAYLVTQQPVAIGKNEYPCSMGLHWAEPDIENAAEKMREVVRDVEKRQRKGIMGRNFVSTQHAPLNVGTRYRQALGGEGVTR